MSATMALMRETGHCPDRPSLSSRPSRSRSDHFTEVDLLQPMDSWYSGMTPAPPPMRSRGAALRRRPDMSLPIEGKGGSNSQHRRAVVNTIWSFVATAAFALCVLLPWRGRQDTLDFVTGFLVEKSLSVDNLFVFLMLFEYFKVPDRYTERVLRWGIISALVLRGIMIAIGVAAVQRFRPVLLVFALILIVSAIKMMKPEEEEDLSENAVMRLAKRMIAATDEYDGDKFFTEVDGKRRATPMLVVLVCIELSDVLFAVDSIPAVVGITQDPLIVYSSNCFALLALRSLYLLLSRSVQQLLYLRHAVALILGFVGVKMVAEYFHYSVPSSTSLAVIIGLLICGTLASLVHNRAAAAGGASNGHGQQNGAGRRAV